MDFKMPSQQNTNGSELVQGKYELSNTRSLKIGSGNNSIRSTKDGLWLGAEKFADAPFAVDMTGVMYLGKNDEITLDGPNKEIFVGNNKEIIIDGVNKKIIVGVNNDVVLDGTTGTITTDKIKDKTYGLNGVFCYTHTSTNTSGNWSFSTGIPDTGGLLNATLNYTDASGHYNLLPGYNTTSAKAYYYVYKSGGFYMVYYYAGNIYSDVTYSTLYFTLTFNSLESNGW